MIPIKQITIAEMDRLIEEMEKEKRRKKTEKEYDQYNKLIWG
jgi:hypothetical protein